MNIYEQVITIIGPVPETFDPAYIVSCCFLFMFVFVLMKIFISIFNHD